MLCKSLYVIVIGLLLSSLNTSCSQVQPTYADSLLRSFVNISEYKRHEDKVTDVAKVLNINNFLSSNQRRQSNIISGILNALEDENFDKIGVNFTISQQCKNDTKYTLENIVGRQQWAFRMLDAFGKPGPGLMNYHLLWIGDYDECINIQAPPSLDMTSEGFNGQYCQLYLPIVPSSGIVVTTGFGASLGVCIPNTCTSDDVVYLFNRGLDFLNSSSFKYRFNDSLSRCQNEDLEFSDTALISITFGSVIAFIIVLATLYDLFAIQLPKVMAQSKQSASLVNQDSDSLDKQVSQSGETNPLLGEKIVTITTEPPEIGVCGKLLLSFSAYTNGLKILSTKQPKGSLKAVHGIRFLSMTWVILGHTIVLNTSLYENISTISQTISKGFAFQVIANATVSVDSFFTLSGLLVGYLTLKELKKNSGSLNWVMFYFHRYWRLTPPLMFLMLVYVPLSPYFATGPVYPQKGLEFNQCRDSWWTNLLYVNNLVRTHELCMGWSWYLANDMQFYILSPLIILPLFHKRILGLFISLIFLLATLITAGVISTIHHMPAGFVSPKGATVDSQIADFFDYYITPYCRMGPYIIGLLAGYYLYTTEMKVKWNKPVVIIGWSVSIATSLAILYGLYGAVNAGTISNGLAAFYNSTSRTAWGACVSWVVVACALGYGGPVNKLLSWKAFIPLSRLTYCAYLVHPIIIYAWFYARKGALYYTDSFMTFMFFAFLVSSYMIAFVLSLMFESPMMGLEAVLFKRQKR